MKLKDTFITHTTENEHLLIDCECNFSGIVRNNSTAAMIVELLKEDTTEKEIAKHLFERFDAPIEQIEEDVGEVIEKLRKIDAIQD